MVTTSPRNSSVAYIPSNGALATRRIFRVTCRSSSTAGGWRFVNQRFGRSRAVSRGNPYRSGAPERYVTTPLLMFPWRSMARSYFPPRNPSAATLASRHVAGDPRRPFHSLIDRETTFAIPGFPSRSSANRVSTAQWISAFGAALRRYATAGRA